MNNWHPFLIVNVELFSDTTAPVPGKALVMLDGCNAKTLGKFLSTERINRDVIYDLIGSNCGDLDPTAIIYDLFPDREGWEQFFLTMAQAGLLEAASHEHRHIYNATTGCCVICEVPWAAIESGRASQRCPGPLPF